MLPQRDADMIMQEGRGVLQQPLSLGVGIHRFAGFLLLLQVANMNHFLLTN